MVSKSSRKPFESVDYENPKELNDMIGKMDLVIELFYNQKFFHDLQKNKEEDGVEEDPTIHQRILIYQSRLLNQLTQMFCLENYKFCYMEMSINCQSI